MDDKLIIAIDKNAIKKIIKKNNWLMYYLINWSKVYEDDLIKVVLTWTL